ncbi:hypothetical protein LWI29_016801 [Acer saccharum]|uniref:Uncharacterized protein n=1 Tax=Acer saccharum TaxID=4024 RepID=A0AA39VXC0_ACESA|nr:hypothetical protein LWI29_016801 [Acer saccharum]
MRGAGAGALVSRRSSTIQSPPSTSATTTLIQRSSSVLSNTTSKKPPVLERLLQAPQQQAIETFRDEALRKFYVRVICWQVGCGAGNTIFPLVAAYKKLYVHACDISPHAIELVEVYSLSHVGFKEDRINAFVCDIVDDSLSEKIIPSSVDVVTLPNGYVLLRDYVIGDFAQVKLHNRNQMIGDGFYVRGDGTMRGAGALVWPTHSRLPSFLDNSIAAVHICHRHRHSHPTVVVGAQQRKCQSLEEHYQRKATKYWNDFYKRHNNKVGCGAGNTVFPLVATYHKLYIHACDISPHAIELVKPNGYVLLRDYAIGDFAQVKLHNRNQMIGDGFYVRGDGTCSFYFSEDFLSSLFLEAGFNTVDISVYSRQIENRSRNITMDRRWIRGIFKKECIASDSALIPEAR